MKILILGGAKSGKSTLALERAAQLGGELIFVATAEARDDEMVHRIQAHQDERGPEWRTMEEPLEVARVLEEAQEGQTLLVDCLTLWLSNLMAAVDKDNDAELNRLIEAFARSRASVILVANEVGLGIVPLEAMTRLYRDLAGRLNQLAARTADEAVFVAAGLPLKLK